MGFSGSEAYSLPLNAKSLVGSMMANLCGSHYPLPMSMVEASSQRAMIDKAFSAPKCVRLAKTPHHLHQLLRNMLGQVGRLERYLTHGANTWYPEKNKPLLDMGQ